MAAPLIALKAGQAAWKFGRNALKRYAAKRAENLGASMSTAQASPLVAQKNGESDGWFKKATAKAKTALKGVNLSGSYGDQGFSGSASVGSPAPKGGAPLSSGGLSPAAMAAIGVGLLLMLKK